MLDRLLDWLADSGPTLPRWETIIIIALTSTPFALMFYIAGTQRWFG